MDAEISYTDELVRAGRTLWSSRRTVALVTASAVVVAVLVSLFLPNSFRARSTFLAEQDRASSFASQIAAAGASIPMGLITMPSTPVDVFNEVLKSRAVRQGVIDELGLIGRYGIDVEDPALARELAMATLGSQVEIVSKRTGLIGVEVTAKTAWFPLFRSDGSTNARVLAADIANAMVSHLNRVLHERQSSTARNSRIYLEQQIAKTKQDLQVAADSLVAYQKRYAAIAIDDQARVTIETLGVLKGQIIAKEVELDVIRKNRTPGSFEIQRVETQLAALERKYAQLVRGEGTSESGGDEYISIADLPDVAMELLRRKQDLELQHTVFSLLTQQFYQASLEEVRDIPTVQLLDEALPPLKKTSPNRRIIVILAFLGGLLAGSAWVLFRTRETVSASAAGAA